MDTPSYSSDPDAVSVPESRRPRPHCGWWLLLLAVAWSPLACQSESLSSLPSAPAERETATKEVSPGDLGVVLQTNRPGSALGEPCHQDQECLQPLRCLELKCAIPPAVDGASTSDTRVVFPDSPSSTEADIEVADTPFERSRGLMFRTRMASDWGMLFIFGGEQPRSFWMRNTFIGLDLVFVDRKGRIVSIAERAKPLDDALHYASTGPARYVIELNAGFCAEHGVRAGQRVVFQNVPGVHDEALGLGVTP